MFLSVGCMGAAEVLQGNTTDIQFVKISRLEILNVPVLNYLSWFSILNLPLRSGLLRLRPLRGLVS